VGNKLRKLQGVARNYLGVLIVALYGLNDPDFFSHPTHIYDNTSFLGKEHVTDYLRFFAA
jgi:hypothetical protein